MAYTAMEPVWRKIDAILAGADAVRAAGKAYLPQYECEGQSEYKRRLAAAPWRNEFEDALRSLSAKPFSQEVMIADGAPKPIEAIAEDIDARGNDLTQFARRVFRCAVAKGYHAILVDYPKMQAGMSLAEEREAGARPYWVHADADEVIALYTAMINGKETVTHVRIRQCTIERRGYSERKVERIREFDRPKLETPAGIEYAPGIWKVWEKQKVEGATDEQWVLIDEGVINRGGSTDIPIVIFWAGERYGEHEVKPPLADLADMQMELYRALSRQDEILTYAGSPMLTAEGMAPPEVKRDQNGNPLPEQGLRVGPKSILYAEPYSDGKAGKWSYIQPDASNIREVRDHTKSVIDDMRRLGMQPITPGTGDVKATAIAVDAAKAHSALEAWALGLKDVLEQAFVYTAEWLDAETDVEVNMRTDFGLDIGNNGAADWINKAYESKLLTGITAREELRRRNLIEATEEDEQERQIEEMQGDPSVDELGAALSYGGEEGESALTPPGEEQFMRDQGITLG